MKPRLSTSVAASVFIAAITIPSGLPAQEHPQTPHHHRYRLVDLGTLGGPNSSVPIVFDEINGTVGARAINNQGTAIALADTSVADPLCFLDDCFYPATVQFRNGVVRLDSLPGGQGSEPNWISDTGLIAGNSLTGKNDAILGLPALHAVSWQSGAINDLGTLAEGSVSTAWAVNDRGQVVGFSTNGTADPFSFYYLQFLAFTGGTQTRAFIWDKQNGMQDLGTLGGPDAWAAQINNRGQVTGISYTSDAANTDNATCFPGVPTQEPFFWDKDSGMIDIGSLGGTCGITNAINNRGQVVGQSYLAGNLIAHAFLWDKSANPRLLDLGTLGGDNAGATWINDAGDVIGYADIRNVPGCSGLICVHHAFLWHNGVITDLGSIGTDPCSRALSINSRQQIVGASAAVCAGELTHGFLWEREGPAVDLNTLVTSGSELSLNVPASINERGEIAGYATLPSGDTHAFVMIPCDEDHPNVEGCDYSEADAQAPTSTRPVLSAASRLSLLSTSSPEGTRFSSLSGRGRNGSGNGLSSSTGPAPVPASTALVAGPVISSITMALCRVWIECPLGSLLITAAVTDQVPIAKVQFYANGRLVKTLPGGPNGVGYEIDYGAPRLGKNVVIVIATDVNGRSATKSLTWFHA